MEKHWERELVREKKMREAMFADNRAYTIAADNRLVYAYNTRFTFQSSGTVWECDAEEKQIGTVMAQ